MDTCELEAGLSRDGPRPLLRRSSLHVIGGTTQLRRELSLAAFHYKAPTYRGAYVGSSKNLKDLKDLAHTKNAYHPRTLGIGLR